MSCSLQILEAQLKLSRNFEIEMQGRAVGPRAGGLRDPLSYRTPLSQISRALGAESPPIAAHHYVDVHTKSRRAGFHKSNRRSWTEMKSLRGLLWTLQPTSPRHVRSRTTYSACASTAAAAKAMRWNHDSASEWLIKPTLLKNRENHDKDPTHLVRHFKDAMSKLPHPVVVITSLGWTGRDKIGRGRPVPCAMTASSFTSLAVQPNPSVVFNVAIPSGTLDAIKTSGGFNVHMLTSDESGARIANYFTKPGTNVPKAGGVQCHDIMGVFSAPNLQSLSIEAEGLESWVRKWEAIMQEEESRSAKRDTVEKPEKSSCGGPYEQVTQLADSKLGSEPDAEETSSLHQHCQRWRAQTGDNAPLLLGPGIMQVFRCKLKEVFRPEESHAIVVGTVEEVTITPDQAGSSPPALGYAQREYKKFGEKILLRDSQSS
ncbi:flavin reductase like domain-containing protein [Xylariaceae sp. FL0016]|nr:flavin reductase like domain-containing protein [Xylariaceae sp. FL0016]